MMFILSFCHSTMCSMLNPIISSRCSVQHTVYSWFGLTSERPCSKHICNLWVTVWVLNLLDSQSWKCCGEIVILLSSLYLSSWSSVRIFSGLTVTSSCRVGSPRDANVPRNVQYSRLLRWNPRSSLFFPFEQSMYHCHQKFTTAPKRPLLGTSECLPV